MDGPSARPRGSKDSHLLNARWEAMRRHPASELLSLVVPREHRPMADAESDRMGRQPGHADQKILIYLTLDGKPCAGTQPANYCRLSYRENIVQWLTRSQIGWAVSQATRIKRFSST